MTAHRNQADVMLARGCMMQAKIALHAAYHAELIRGLEERIARAKGQARLERNGADEP